MTLTAGSEAVVAAPAEVLAAGVRSKLRRRLQLSRVGDHEEWDGDCAAGIVELFGRYHLALIAERVSIAPPGSVAVITYRADAGIDEIHETADRLNAWAEGRNILVVTSDHEVRIEPRAEPGPDDGQGGPATETEPGPGEGKPPATGRRTGTQAKRTAAKEAAQ